MTTTFGTAHFVSKAEAIRYYADYEHDPERAVETKLREGSIHIGKPALKLGQKLMVDRQEGRYFISDSKPDPTNELTAVIFRTFTNRGDVIALFPLEPSDPYGHHCLSYQRIGQHGGATPDLMRGQSTRPSTPAEVCDLACELRGLGYKLRALTRFPRNAFEVRKAKLARQEAA